jgi:uncharacterized glyoxalase superfamily protein PhnB
MRSFLQAKSMAKALRKALAERQVVLSHSECLELVSRQFGFVDWNMLAAAMKDQVTVQFSIVVQHGRQRQAADFYESVFGAKQVRDYVNDNELLGLELQLGSTRFGVSGANPKREAEPSRGGPFYPKAPGAVSSAVNVEVSEVDRVLRRALGEGATLRFGLELDTEGRRCASFYDPFGHIWGLVERAPSGKHPVVG